VISENLTCIFQSCRLESRLKDGVVYLRTLSNSIAYGIRSGIDVLSMLLGGTWNPTSRRVNPISSAPIGEALLNRFFQH
jgi:hypothetical protein